MAARSGGFHRGEARLRPLGRRRLSALERHHGTRIRASAKAALGIEGVLLELGDVVDDHRPMAFGQQRHRGRRRRWERWQHRRQRRRRRRRRGGGGGRRRRTRIGRRGRASRCVASTAARSPTGTRACAPSRWRSRRGGGASRSDGAAARPKGFASRRRGRRRRLRRRRRRRGGRSTSRSIAKYSRADDGATSSGECEIQVQA